MFPRGHPDSWRPARLDLFSETRLTKHCKRADEIFAERQFLRWRDRWADTQLRTRSFAHPLLQRRSRVGWVTTCGRICFNRQQINLGQVFAGQTRPRHQTYDRIWTVSSMAYD